MGTLRVIVSIFLFACLAHSSHGQDRLRAPNRKGKELRRTPVVKVFEDCKDSVVNFVNQRVSGDKPELWEFIRIPQGKKDIVETNNVGSGLVIHKDGLIITNAHVVSQTVSRTVVLANGESYPADIIGIDRKQDLALVKINAPHPLKPATLAIPNDLMVGETLIAIGNPHGLQHTCTTGIVSAIGRRIDVDKKFILEGVIQADVGINPGHSGGPLFNALGEVIGVVVSKRSDSANIAFAIPIVKVRREINRLLDVERRMGIRTGVTFQPKGGIEVKTGSPAYTAGLRTGDRVETADNRIVDSPLDFSLACFGKKEGEVLSVRYTRGDASRDVAIKLTGRTPPDGEKLLVDLLKFKVKPLNAALVEAIGFRYKEGLVLTSVTEGFYRGKDVPEPGDVLVRIGVTRPTSIEHAGKLLEQVSSGDSFLVSVIRNRDGKITRINTTVTVH